MDPLNMFRQPKSPMREPPANALAVQSTCEPEVAQAQGMQADTFERAISRLSTTGPEIGGGLSNHGPMAVEALHHLGEDQAIAAWLDGYMPKLEPFPSASGRAPRLGQLEDVADWTLLFERELTSASWRAVVGRWVPLLAPGVFAAAAHGLLRTSHATRALREADTPVRRAELARGLGYWAASYQPLPGSVRARGQRSVAELLATLPRIPRADSFLLSEGIHDVDRVPELAEHLSQLDAAELEPRRLLAGLAPWARAGAQVSVFAHVHVLTGTVALLEFEDLLAPACMHELLEHAWHAVAAMVATWRPPTPVAVAGPIPVRSMLIAKALGCADEHGIKLVDACLSAHERFDLPELLYAADALVAGLG
jgi:hypothetical protein